MPKFPPRLQVRHPAASVSVVAVAALAVAASLLLSGCILPVPSWNPNVPLISGEVLDAKTRKPVENAEIVLEDRERHGRTETYQKTKTHTDAEGRFLTRPDGTWFPITAWLPASSKVFMGNLLVSHDGYYSERQEYFVSDGTVPINRSPRRDLKAPILLTPHKPQPRKTAAQ